MNPFVFFSVAFATSTVVLAYALLAMRDDNKRLRAAFNRLCRAKLVTDTHLEAASELLYHCQMLEARNDALEAWMSNFKDTLAGAKLTAPGHINESEKLVVKDTERAP